MADNDKRIHNQAIKEKLFELLKQAIKLIGEFEC